MPHGGSDCTHVSPGLEPYHQVIELTSSFRIQFMRDLLLFFGVKFKITPFRRSAAPANGAEGEDEEDEEEERNPTLQAVDGREGTGEVLVSCLGIGYSNVNKAMA